MALCQIVNLLYRQKILKITDVKCNHPNLKQKISVYIFQGFTLYTNAKIKKKNN